MTPTERHAEAILRAVDRHARFYTDLRSGCGQAILAAVEAAMAEGAAMGWQPIETAPEVRGKYFFCRLAWGPLDDRCTGDGFRWNGKWFAAAHFYKGGRFDECQHEMRQIEVNPTHWQPLPTPPTTAEETTK